MISKILIITILIILLLLFLIWMSKKQKYEHFILPSNIDIYIINLDKDRDRLQNLKNKNKNPDLNLIRHPAVLGKNVKPSDKLYRKYLSPEFKHSGNFIKSSVIGCSLSHHTLYDKLYHLQNNQSKFHIICEDDAEIVDNFPEKLRNILNQLPEDWDFVYLGISKAMGKKYSKNLLIPKQKKGYYGNYGSFGYMISSKGLQKLHENSNQVKDAIDIFFKTIPDFKKFISYPFLIKHNFDFLSNNAGKKRSEIKTSYEKVIYVD